MKTIKKLRMLVVRPVRDSALNHFKYFKKVNVDYTIVSDNPYKPDVTNLNKNVTVDNHLFYIPRKFKLINKLIPFYNLEWKLVDELIEEKVKKADAVNVTDTYYFYTTQVAKLAKKYNKPLITTIWMTISNHITSWFAPYSFNTRFVINNTKLFILRNKTAYRFTDSLGIKRNKTTAIYKGVDINLFKPRNKKNNEKVNILFVGVLIKSKGIDSLIKVFKKLSKKYRNIKLTIVGSGRLEKSLKKLAFGYPVKFYGYTNYQKLANIFSQADIFCAPSRPIYWFGIKVWEEYFSYTLMEAQAAGLPIVTTNIGGIPEEVDNKNYLIPPNDKKALYNAIESLILDSKKRIELGKINRLRAEKLFDAKKQAKLTEDAILALMN